MRVPCCKGKIGLFRGSNDSRSHLQVSRPVRRASQAHLPSHEFKEGGLAKPQAENVGSRLLNSMHCSPTVYNALGRYKNKGHSVNIKP